MKNEQFWFLLAAQAVLVVAMALMASGVL